MPSAVAAETNRRSSVELFIMTLLQRCQNTAWKWKLLWPEKNSSFFLLRARIVRFFFPSPFFCKHLRGVKTSCTIPHATTSLILYVVCVYIYCWCSSAPQTTLKFLHQTIVHFFFIACSRCFLSLLKKYPFSSRGTKQVRLHNPSPRHFF